MRGASTNCFYKRLFRLAGNERLKTQADQTQAHAHAAGAMALDGLGLASGLIATGARLGCGLDDLRIGLRCRCRLGLNDGRLDLLDLGCYYLSGSHDLGLERVGIRASRRTKALEVALWTPTGSFPRSQVSRVLADAAHPTSIVRVMSKGEKKARRVSKVEMLAGEGSWTENIAEGQMRLSAPSFFQVNTKGAEILIELVMEALDPQEDELAVDLYCGAGTFTLPLARRCDFVAAVEAYGPAVRDLRRNLEINKLDNVDVIGGDAVREFPDQDADILVVDPPRAGLAPEAIDLIASTSAHDVAYVSCDPATLARDLKRFVEEGTFSPVKITPVDLFPQTFHCETVVHLRRN